MIVKALTDKKCLDCGKKIKKGERVRITRLVDIDTFHILNEHRCVKCEHREDGSVIIHNTNLGSERYAAGLNDFNIGALGYQG